MTTNIDDLIVMLTQARAEAQAEADAAIDRHNALDRALTALCPPEPSLLSLVIGDEALFAVVTALPTGPRHGRRQPTDYQAIADWINAAKRDGSYSISTMAEHFGVTWNTAKNHPGRCREKGLLDPPPSRPFSEQLARDNAAGPSQGALRPLTFVRPPDEATTPPAPRPEFSLDDAARALA